MRPNGLVDDDPVVIVGFSFRFPQDAISEDGFWDIICRGRSTMTEVPADRYNIDGFHANGKARHGTTVARGGHFLKDDISTFDASFFNMGGMEAKAMDPQIRILLETTYHALESSGIPLQNVMGSQTSVYVGSLGAEYALLYGADEEINEKYQATGTAGAMISNRISRFYDLHGPSITLDTACSSSLIALHLAVQSLLQGESEMSLVCGSQLQLEPRSLSVQASRLNFLSPDSHSYSFDERANGYSRGEGIGVVVLKRLSKALEDGDTIRAVIRGTSANQDGRTASVTMPSSTAQAALIKKAYECLGQDLNSTGYFEAHGTGTAVGDPIEIRAISSVFTETRTAPLYIGSVKANIGHLEATAGVAGLIKSVLAVERGIIPPNALLRSLNPAIHANEWNMEFPTSAIDWPTDGLRRASINSFGFGGANCHVIIDDAFHYLQSRRLKGFHNTFTKSRQNGWSESPISTPNEDEHRSVPHIDDPSSVILFPITAADEAGIKRCASVLASHLDKIDHDNSIQYLYNLAWTLSKKRSLLPWKSFAVASTLDELRLELSEFSAKPISNTDSPEICFVFTGQGVQWASMGKELFLHHQVFRDSMLRADAYFRSLGSDWSLVHQLYEMPSSAAINDAALAQPFCTALQVALIDLLTSWHVYPKAVVGHSSGEIAAAYSVGAITDESAWRVAYLRGQAVLALSENKQVPRGSMLAVALSESELAPHIAAVVGGESSLVLTCACINSAKNTTVSGLKIYIDKLAERLRGAGIFARELDVPVAYHSAQMLEAARSYTTSLQGTLSAPATSSLISPKTVLFSSVTGNTISNDELLTAEYWVSNLVSRVRFSEAFERMMWQMNEAKDGAKAFTKQSSYFIEIGPHSALERPIKDIMVRQQDWVYDCVLRRGLSGLSTATSLAGRLFARDYPISITAVNTHIHSVGPPKPVLGLPSYPFDHSKSYWLESQLSRNHRFRKSPRNDLLGNPSREWSPLEPKWRFTIRAPDLPWVTDHKIEETIIYPAAGMLVMALEGIKSLTQGMPNIAGYRLTDISITSALLVPSTDSGIETQLHMHQQDGLSTDPLMQAWNFRIYSTTNDVHKLHCSGQISVEQTVSDTTNETSKSFGISTEVWQDFLARCSSKIDVSLFYKEIALSGARFGAAFQRLTDIYANVQGREAKALSSFAEWTRLAKDQEISPHVIHPTTLDSLLQVIFAAGRDELRTLPTMVPTKISAAYFTRKLLDGPSSNAMLSCGYVTKRGISHLEGEAIGFDTVSGEPLVVLKGCSFSGFRGVDSVMGGPDGTHLFHQLEWKPDISLLSNAMIEQYCINETKTLMGGGIQDDFERVSRYFMVNAIQQVTPELCQSYDESKFHFPKYIDWLRGFLDEASITEVGCYHDIDSSFLSQFASGSLDKKNLVLFGQNLVPILKGEVDALALLFNEGILDSFYQSHLFSFTAHRLAAYMDLLAHKQSDLTIIEVGAGTGSTTSIVMNTLYQQGKHKGSPRFRRYDFTDISPAFFAKAQERYTQQANRMRYKTLDLEKDPVDQGFEPHSYDVVIAVSVLHATKNIDQTLRNIKKLLKPGGQLLLSEPTNLQMASIPFFSGVLQGWWLSSESYRNMGPLMSTSQWNDALKQCGFDGVNIALPDGPEATHGLSLIVSSSLCAEPIQRTPRTVIIHETAEQNSLSNTLQAHLTQSSNAVCKALSIDEFAYDEGDYDQCICLWELEGPKMGRLSDVQFACLQRMMATSKEVLWINDSCGEAPKKPEATMIAGFAKTLARERPNLSFVHLNVELGTSTEANILTLLDHRQKADPRHHETDLLEMEGVIHIPRAIEAPLINRLFDSEIHRSKVDTVDSGTIQDSLTLTFSPGQLTSFRFVEEKSNPAPLLPEEVEVRVMATGLNFKDVLVALNRVHADTIGQEFAGQVVQVGSALNGVFQPGDRICGIARGSFKTHVRTNRSCVMNMPTSMSYTEAAAIPLVYVTAQYALIHLARLEAGETVLIHAAAGGVGQAAIQIAQGRQARILATVGTPEKKQLLVDQYGIDPGDIFSSRHLAFAQEVLDRTKGRGVDVVLNSLSGRALTETWRCMAPLGRFIEIGKRDINLFNSLPMSPFQHNISFCSVDIDVILRHKESLMQQLMNEVAQIVLTASPSQLSAPYPLSIFKRSGFEEALRLIQTGQHIGKVVIDWDAPDTIQVIRKRQLDYTFDSDATYIIAGGLGGIGRNTAEWMQENGAKHLILLSRSGPKADVAVQLVQKLRQQGVNVYAPKCDIIDAEALRSVVLHAEQNMPPIKGCIQSSMVVENRVFRDYTLDEFQSSIDPKVKGTWNLHNVLPKGLEFFVLLSSLAGVHGASSQSNYAAGSAFLDAFARYRHSCGEHCISLDLGLVESIGYVAERIDVAQTLAMTYTDQKYLTERDLHFMLRYACRPPFVNASSSAWETQLICGMTTPAFVQRAGTVQDYGWMRSPMFCHLYQMEFDTKVSTAAKQADSAGSLLKSASSVEEAAETIASLLAKRLARSLSVPIESIDPRKPPSTFGVDSLVAVELLHWFSTEIRTEIPVVQILGSMSIAELAMIAAETSEYLIDQGA